MKQKTIFSLSTLLFLPLFVISQSSILFPTDGDWYDTSLDYTLNEDAFIVVNGAHLGDESNNVWAYGPGGANIVNDSLPQNALLGKIGVEGNPFYIGVGGKIESDVAGRLYLKVNDSNVSDNFGFLVVKLLRSPIKTILHNTVDNWNNTGVMMESDSSYFVRAAGAHADNPGLLNWIYAPSGANRMATGLDVFVEGLPDNCLLGKIGESGDPFYIGDGGLIAPETTEELYIVVNDGDLTNNVGHLLVEVFANEDITTGIWNPDDEEQFVNVFPNPFSDVTQLTYELTNSSIVNIAVINQNGQIIENIFSGDQMSGSYSFDWDTGNQAPGLYYFILQINGKTLAKKVMLVK